MDEFFVYAHSQVFECTSKQSGNTFACKTISKLSDTYDHPSLEKEVYVCVCVRERVCVKAYSRFSYVCISISTSISISIYRCRQ